MSTSTSSRPGVGTLWAGLPVLALLLVTAAWGSTFVLLHDVAERIPAADYMAVRFALATLVLAALRPRSMMTMPAALRSRAAGMGLLFGAGNLLLTAGLAHTAASVSGFLTGMYVVFTPLFGAVLLRMRVGAPVWAATALATAGLATITFGGTGGLGAGELITLGGAAMFALHIIALGRWADARYAIEMAVVQCAATAVLSGLLALPGGITLPAGRTDWLGMIYTAVVVGAMTMLLQTWAQARLHPARAAVIMTLEPVWAAVFAIGLGSETFTWRLAVGGALVLLAMYLCERHPPALNPARPRRAPAPTHAWRSPPRLRR